MYSISFSDQSYPRSPSLLPPTPLRLCYVLLSPTFGMHQYTADYANRMAAAGHDVHLVTTTTYPADRYAPNITVHTPITTHNTGFNLAALRSTHYAVRMLHRTLAHIAPDLLHFTGPHLWNPLLLRRTRIPTLHTLHDLDPHPGSPYGPLLHLWNGAVLRTANHILVHGQGYQARLSVNKVTYLPLLHLFLSYELRMANGELKEPPPHHAQPPTVLFFGRLEAYKGVAVLLEAWAQFKARGLAGRLILAGGGDLARLWPGALPPGVELRNRCIADAEALALFQQCSLVVLPYTGATQSALIPAAYYFAKPVIATRSGALPEYVIEDETGWLVPPGDSGALARAFHKSLRDTVRLQQFGGNGKTWYNQQRPREENLLLQLYARLAGLKQG